MFLLSVLLALPVQEVRFPLPPPSEPDGCGKAAQAARAAQHLGQLPPPAPRGRLGVQEAISDTDVLHYDLDLEIVPSAEWIGGSNVITVQSQVDGLTTFGVRVSNAFNVSARVNGASAPWTRADSATIEVTLDRAYDTGEEFAVEITYDGYPDQGGFGGVEFAWQNGQRVVWTLSETWYAYTWWPTKDDNTDKATANLRFTVPDDMVVASNGLQQPPVSLSGNRMRYEWTTGYPTATYLFSFAATNYNTFGATYDYGLGTMPLEFFVFPASDTPNNRQAWLKTVDMLEVFDGLFGRYPFIDEKYGMAQFGWSGGMEHQTMTSQGGFWESVTAHELGHQWWGDMTTCATWHDIWLNEGFATYSEALWFEYESGARDEQALFDWMAVRRPNNFGGSVYVYDATDLGAIFSSDNVYRKGGWVLHQLRHVLGETTFFDLLAAYRSAHEYGSATTADFQVVAEATHGSDLDWFFDTWVYDVGAPAYEYGWAQHSVAGRSWVEVSIEQVQSASYPTFTMPLDVVTTTSGQDTTHVVWNDEDHEHLLFETAGPIDSLALDPDDWTLHTSNQPVAFVKGPPKIVAVVPEPGRSVRRGRAEEILVVFHTDVQADSSDFALVGDGSGPQGFTYGYSATTRTVSLQPLQALPTGWYTLSVSDDVVDGSTALPLDGEVSDPSSASSLPSGDGLPGGSSTFRFRIVRDRWVSVTSDLPR